MPITNDTNVVSLDALGPRADPNTFVEKNRQAADEMSITDAAKAGFSVSGPGALIEQMMTKAKQRIEGTDQFDPKFASGVADRIIADFPDANDNELRFLTEHGANQSTYDAAVQYVLNQRKTNAIVEHTTVGTATKFITNVAPEVAAGIGIARVTKGMQRALPRLAAGVGLNAAEGYAYEMERQRYALEQSNENSAVGSALLSGALGGVFDGLTHTQRAGALNSAVGFVKDSKVGAAVSELSQSNIAQSVKGLWNKITRRGKPVIDEATSAADGAAKQADSVVAVAESAGKQADSAAASAVEAGAKQADNIDLLKTAAADTAKQADSMGLLKGAAQDVANQADQVVNPIEAMVAQYVDGMLAHADNTDLYRNVLEDAPQATQDYLKAADEMAAQMPPVTQQAVTQTAKRVTSEVAQSAAQDIVSAAKLKLDDVSRTFSPTFENPVDKALAIVGSHSKPELSVAALNTLRTTFPGHSDEVLRSMASDFVDNHMMPVLRSSSDSAKKLPSWSDKVDASRYLPTEELAAKVASPAELQKYADSAEVTSAHLSPHPADVDGSIMASALKEANTLVTKAEIDSKFAELSKTRKGLADVMNKRIEEFFDEHLIEPSVNKVRQMMADEVYGRKLFDQVKRNKQAGFIKPKMAITLGGAAVASLFIADNAEAGTGGAVGEASVLLTGMMVVFGGKGMFKALAAAKALTPALRKAGTKAERMLADGVDPEAIKKATGFEVRNGELALAIPKGDVNSLLDHTGTLSSEALDDLASRMEGFTERGTPVGATVSYSVDAWVNEAAAGHLGAGYLKVTVPFTDKVIELPNSVRALRSRNIRMESSQSETARMVGRLINSAPFAREGGVATEMTTDALGGQIMGELINKVEQAYTEHLGQRYVELGIKKPAFFAVAQREADVRMFREEVTRARLFPNDTTISQAARNASKAQFEVEKAFVSKAVNLVAEMEAAGVKLPDTHPLKKLSQLVPSESYVRRVGDREKIMKLQSMEGVGAKGVRDVLEDAIRAGEPDIPAALVPDFAVRLYRTMVEAANPNSKFFLSKVNADTMVKELVEAGYDEALARRAAGLFQSFAPGHIPGQLKERGFNLDMSVKKTFQTPTGPVTVSMLDIYKSDGLDLFSNWARGLVGTYSWGMVGFKHRIDLLDANVRDALVSRMREEGATEWEIANFEESFKNDMGIGGSADFFGTAESFERTVSGLATFELGSNFVFNIAGEFGAMVGLIPRALAAIPRAIKTGIDQSTLNTAVKEGKLSKAELQQLDEVLSHQLNPSPTVVAAIDGNFESVLANRIERGNFIANKLNLMHWTKKHMVRLAAAALQHDVVSYVTTGALSDARMFKHYASVGLDKAVMDEIAPFMRDSIKRNAETGAFEGFDYNRWAAKSPSTLETYQQALRKMGAQVSSEAFGYGETSAWLTSNVAGRQLGKLTSSVQVLNQKLQRDIVNFDGIVMRNWVNSFVMSVAQYIIKVQLYYGHDAEEVRKRTSYQQLMWAGVRNSAVGGLWTNVLDSGLSLTGLLPGGITGYVDNKTGASGSSLVTMSAMNNPKLALSGLTGLLVGGEYDNYTRQEFLAGQRMVAPLWSAGVVASWLSKDMPTANETKPADTPDASPFN